LLLLSIFIFQEYVLYINDGGNEPL